MARTTNPMPDLPPPPPVSRRTVAVTGLLVDFYGLDELPADTATVSMLWLHHPRLGDRARMADIAARCVQAVAEQAEQAKQAEQAERSEPHGRGGPRHRLVAAAFDQRNHGSRLVAPLANEAWRDGNPTHAQDMFGTIAGTVADTRLLMDLVDGYPGGKGAGAGASAGAETKTGAGTILPAGVAVAQHLVLGVSLGGHSGWQLLFADPRVTAGVLVIGCPDYMRIMVDRARLSKRPSYTAQTAARPFLGSADFPAALVAACRQYDPRGILFGTDEAAWPQTAAGEDQLRRALQQRLAGKRLLVCSGGSDKLVPYAGSAPLLRVLQRAAAAWPALGLSVQDQVYAGVGHQFSSAMVHDAVRFVVAAVEGRAEARASKL